MRAALALVVGFFAGVFYAGMRSADWEQREIPDTAP